MYVLNLAEDNRILSAWNVIEGQDYSGMLIVNTLPDGDVTDYMYVDGEYIYDPLPRPEEPEPEPTTDEVLNVLLGIGGEA